MKNMKKIVMFLAIVLFAIGMTFPAYAASTNTAQNNSTSSNTTNQTTTTKKSKTANTTTETKKKTTKTTKTTNSNKKQNNTQEENTVDNQTVTEDSNDEQADDTDNLLRLQSISVKGVSQKGEEEITVTPAFHADVYEYEATISKEITSLKIDAVANEADATIEVLGADSLKEGENTVTILVNNSATNEQQTYQIMVTQKETNTAGAYWKQYKKYLPYAIGVVAIIVLVICIIAGSSHMKKVRKIRENEFGGHIDLFDDDDYQIPGNVVNVSKESNESIVKESKVEERTGSRKKGKRFK